MKTIRKQQSCSVGRPRLTWRAASCRPDLRSTLQGRSGFSEAIDSNAIHPPGWKPGSTAGQRPAATSLLGFTLVEIMVVVVLLSVIVLGLMAMFNQTQRAFRAGMTQTDVLEAGRMFTDQLARELQQVTPSYQTNALNFYAQVPNYTPLAPLQQKLPVSTALRTNILEDLFFVSRVNQTWNGIGYFVRTNPSYFGNVDLVGSLYRFETNVTRAQFEGNGLQPYLTYRASTNFGSISKVLDGVVHFRVRCYDTSGAWITNGSPVVGINPSLSVQDFVTAPPVALGEVEAYAFSNNIVPAYLEVEMGVLEPQILRRYNSIPNVAARSNYLAEHVGNVQLFRQRIALRNLDPCAYTTNHCPVFR